MLRILKRHQIVITIKPEINLFWRKKFRSIKYCDYTMYYGEFKWLFVLIKWDIFIPKIKKWN